MPPNVAVRVFIQPFASCHSGALSTMRRIAVMSIGS